MSLTWQVAKAAANYYASVVRLIGLEVGGRENERWSVAIVDSDLTYIVN